MSLAQQPLAYISRLILAVLVVACAPVVFAVVPSDPGVPDLTTRETART